MFIEVPAPDSQIRRMRLALQATCRAPLPALLRGSHRALPE